MVISRFSSQVEMMPLLCGVTRMTCVCFSILYVMYHPFFFFSSLNALELSKVMLVMCWVLDDNMQTTLPLRHLFFSFLSSNGRMGHKTVLWSEEYVILSVFSRFALRPSVWWIRCRIQSRIKGIKCIFLHSLGLLKALLGLMFITQCRLTVLIPTYSLRNQWL